MSLPFNPAFLYSRATSIEGFSDLKLAMEARCSFTDAVFNSLQYVADEYSYWDSEQGFGSSDTTYAIKSFVDYLIGESYLVGEFDTKFTPRLSVVKLKN